MLEHGRQEHGKELNSCLMLPSNVTRRKGQKQGRLAHHFPAETEITLSTFEQKQTPRSSTYQTATNHDRNPCLHFEPTTNPIP